MTQTPFHFPLMIGRIESPQLSSGGGLNDERSQWTGRILAREKGVFVVDLTSDHNRRWKLAAEADVLVLRHVNDPDFLPLIKKRRAQGKITVYEIGGDPNGTGTWRSVPFLRDANENMALIECLVRFCDALQLTRPLLRDLFGHLHPVCRVFPEPTFSVRPERDYRGTASKQQDESRNRSNLAESGAAGARVGFYRELLLKANGGEYVHQVCGLANGWASTDGAVVSGRHIHLAPTKFELLLKDGLATMQIPDCGEKAFRIFRRASAIEPSNELPYLHGAPVSPDPVKSLMKAVELNSDSLQARLMLGDIHAGNGNGRESLQWFKEASAVFPEYELPSLRAASLPEPDADPARPGFSPAAHFLPSPSPAMLPTNAQHL